MSKIQKNLTAVSEDENRDLGFGSKVAGESRRRLLNRDGSFNVARTGLNPLAAFSLYHSLLQISWAGFFGFVVIGYLIANSFFALAYVLCGSEALLVPENQHIGNRFWEAFFFSVHTMATIGYGNITPVGIAANLIVTFEALFGLMGFALITGMLFARFSRPTAKILFSENAVIAPYRDLMAFEFRITNGRCNEIIELHATVMYSQFEDVGGRRLRRFYPLQLERERVAFFTLSWTLVHPIDESSPLFGKTEQELLAADAEVLVLLTGIDETFSQTVHTRSSYKADEIIWQAKFGDIYNQPTPTGRLTIDVRKLHSIERLNDTND
ncbi:MAG TPA: ion channel [Blastocatellia bacterium]|nr:ion channel [Blastocatellia bacterium]